MERSTAQAVPAAVTGAGPKAQREPAGRWIGGVCTGLSAHLGWPLPLLRVAMLVLALANGIGVVLYFALWAVLPLRRDEDAGTRQNDVQRMLAFGALVLGLVAVAYAWGWGTFRTWVAPVLVIGLGAAIVWQQSGRTALRDRRYQLLVAAAGAVLILAGAALVLAGQVGWQQGLQALSIVLLIVGGVALVASPWLVRIYRELSDERRARIHEQERTEIAAQVHDSVLQTLTLIQRSADDGREVRRLARSEERRLRGWLYEPAGNAHTRLAAALTDAAARVEDDHGIPVELVVVGDAPLSAAGEALVAAGTEAMVNAAKHALPDPQLSVYCEITDAGAELFVRDRGPGFDVDAVPADRHGIRDSIVGRLERVGGSAEFVVTALGTEVRMAVPAA